MTTTATAITTPAGHLQGWIIPDPSWEDMPWATVFKRGADASRGPGRADTLEEAVSLVDGDAFGAVVRWEDEDSARKGLEAGEAVVLDGLYGPGNWG